MGTGLVLFQSQPGVPPGQERLPLFAGGLPRGMARDLATAARRKQAALDSAEHLEDLRIPPGNRFEAPRGARRSAFGPDQRTVAPE